MQSVLEDCMLPYDKFTLVPDKVLADLWERR
jgi:hypothetical protein